MEKILVLIPRYYPDNYANGPNKGCQSFVNLLKDINCEVEMWTHKTTDLSHNDNLNIKRFKPSNIFKLSPKLLISFKMVISLIKKRNDYDLFYSRAWYDLSSSILIFILLILNKKVVVSSSGRFSHYNNIRLRRKILVHKLFFWLNYKKLYAIHWSSHIEKKSCRRFSPKSKKDLIAQTFHNIKKVENNDIEIKGTNLIYSVSRVSPEKNLEKIFREFSSLNDNDIIYVHFGGSKSDNQILNKLAKKYNIKVINNIDYNPNQKSFFSAGFCSYEQIYNTVNSFDNRIFVQRGESEGTSNSVLEALYNNIPCCLSSGCNMKFDQDKLIDYDLNSLYKKVKNLKKIKISEKINNYISQNLNYNESKKNTKLFLKNSTSNT